MCPLIVRPVFMDVSYKPVDHTTRSEIPVGFNLSDVCRCTITGFRREVSESCTLLGYYAAREVVIFRKKLLLLAA